MWRTSLSALCLLSFASCGGIAVLDADQGAASGGRDSVATSTGLGGSRSSSSSGSDPSQVHVSAIESVFFADPYLSDPILYIQATIDGEEDFIVVQVLGDQAHIIARRPDLHSALPRIERVDATTLIKLRTDASRGDELAFEVINVADLRVPSSELVRPLFGQVDPAWRQVFSVESGNLLLCVRPTEGAPLRIVRVSLRDELQGGKAMFSSVWPSTGAFGQGLDERPCGGGYRAEVTLEESGGSAMAHPSGLWASWGRDTDLHIWRIAANHANQLAEYAYNPSGVHQYGPVLSAATDGTVVALDPKNDSEFFLWNALNGATSITHAVLGLQGPKRLMGVIGRHLYVANATTVARYAVSEDNTVTPDPNVVNAEFGEVPRPLAESPSRLALVANDQLYMVPVDLKTPAIQLRFVSSQDGSGP